MKKKPKIRLHQSKPSRLTILANDLVRLKRELSDHENQYQHVYNKRRRLEDNIAALEVQIKDLAREKAREGETYKVIDNDEISVQVASYYTPVRYDVQAAKSFWPADVFKKVTSLVIDPKLVKEMIESGELSEKQVARAMEERELATPAVTIRPKF